MAEESITIPSGSGAPAVKPGTAGIQSQVPGQPSTVSALAGASGGIAPGNLVEQDIDKELFSFQSEDTALMSLMGRARKVKVSSPEVQHYQIDEQRASLKTSSAVTAASSAMFELPMAAEDQGVARPHDTLLLCGVDGYKADGATRTPGECLMAFVTGINNLNGNPVCRASNGPRANASSASCTTPAIPAGTRVIIMGNALYETQKEVDPSLILPKPTEVYLQKRGMNQVISDYFDAQKKRVPFSQAVIAEAAIMDFKRRGNRTLWAGRKGKLTVTVPKLGNQTVYFTEGLRYQFRREVKHAGSWAYEKLIALAKLFFTGEDVPKTCIWLCGKNLLEELQCIDYKKHPEVQITSAVNKTTGWQVTRITTVFGDIDIKREPTLDTLGWSNSGALLGEDRLVHYMYSQEHQFNDRIEGEEATRKGLIVWDAVALKGACHIWVDGEGESPNAGADTFIMWDKATAPSGDDLVDGGIYYLLADCPGISARAQNGQSWKAAVTVTGSGAQAVKTAKWSEYAAHMSLG